VFQKSPRACCNYYVTPALLIGQLAMKHVGMNRRSVGKQNGGRAGSSESSCFVNDEQIELHQPGSDIDRHDCTPADQRFSEVRCETVLVAETNQLIVWPKPVQNSLSDPVPLQRTVDNDASMTFLLGCVRSVIVDAVRIPHSSVIEKQADIAGCVVPPRKQIPHTDLINLW
jgi:hypothetical protein